MEPPDERPRPGMAWGAWTARDHAVLSWTLRPASARQLLDRLAEGPASLDDLARDVGVGTATACRLLHHLVACGVAAADGPTYRLGPVARMQT